MATVDEYGIVTVHNEGFAIIKVSSEDGTVVDTCELYVSERTDIDDDIYIEDPDDYYLFDDYDFTDDPVDNTVADRIIPRTGSKIILLALGLIVVFGASRLIIYKCIKTKSK